MTTRGGEVFEADRVIVTLPPTLAGRLEYAPALPSWRDQLTQRLPAGSVIKLYAVYDEPVLAGRGAHRPGCLRRGTGQGDLRQLASRRDPRGADGLHGGQRRPGRRPPVPRGAPGRAVACFVRYFGPKAAHPIEYIERDWMAEEFSRGCYGAHFTPGVWGDFGPALTEPVGPHPLGGGRVLGGVERLHGGGGAFGRGDRPHVLGTWPELVPVGHRPVRSVVDIGGQGQPATVATTSTSRSSSASVL